MHLVGFIIRTYRDARSSECQILIHDLHSCHVLYISHHIRSSTEVKVTDVGIQKKTDSLIS